MKSEADITVLLAEGSVSGHRLAYVRLLAEEALERKYQVHIALPAGSTECQEFATHLNHLAHKVRVETLPSLKLRDLEALSLRVKAKRTVVTDGDALAIQLARAGGWKGEGRLSILIMRECAQPDKNPLKMWIKNQAKRFVHSRVSQDDYTDLAILKSSLWAGQSKLPIALDPVQLQCTERDVARIRESWNLDSSTFWFGVIGAITERKNVPLIAASLASVSSDRVGLLVAGKIDPRISTDIQSAVSHLASLGKSTKVVDRLLSDVELDAAVLAVDCLVLAHSNEGPSGLLGKAVAAGTQVLASGASSLKNDVAALGDSARWLPLDPPSLSAGLQLAMARPVRSEGLGATTSSFLEVLLPCD